VPRLFKCPICVKMVPLRAFVERLRSIVREGIVSTSYGIWPLNMLLERSKNTICVKLPRLVGMLLSKKLFDRERLLSCVILPNDCGISPSNRFWDRSRSWRLERRPISSGKVPVNRFSARLSFVSL